MDINYIWRYYIKPNDDYHSFGQEYVLIGTIEIKPEDWCKTISDCY